MTEKELQKLKKQDYLQLLLTQGQEMVELQARLEEATAELEQIQQTDERLKEKLNEKDELIERLKSRLDLKDATIHSLEAEMEEARASRRIELDDAGSMAMAAMRLNGVFEAAQQAADQYLYNIKLRHGELDGSTDAALGTYDNIPDMPDVSETDVPARQSIDLRATFEKIRTEISDKTDKMKSAISERMIKSLEGLLQRMKNSAEKDGQ